jgi:hypothetical protein
VILFVFVIPFLYALVYIFWAMMIVSLVVVYVSACAIIFVVGLVCAVARECLRSQRPRSPRYPVAPRPIPQARFSSRR